MGLAPGLAPLRGYRRSWLRGDVLAGIGVAAYLIPQVMAYAKIAGLPPVSGLWAAIAPLALYAVFGSSRQLSVGPEASTAVMTGAALAPLAAGDPVRAAALAAMLAVLVGAVCLAGGLARLGFIADLLSRPVLAGYLAGIGLIMIVSQLGTVTRIPVGGEDIYTQLRSFGTRITQAHWPTIALGATALVLLLVLGRLVPHAPVPLIVVLLGTVAVVVFRLPQAGIAVVGDIPRGLPVPGVPRVPVSDVPSLLLPAAGIALVGFSDVAITGRAFARRRGQSLDANQELRALGLANIGAGFLRGFPVSSSASRTVIGDALGSRTQLYSLVALAAVLATLLAAGPVLAEFPSAVLSALVIYAALRLIDIGEFRRIAAFRRSEFVLAVATTVAVLGLGVLYGIGVAIGLSVVDLLRRMARPHDGILGYVPGMPGMHDIDDYPGAELVPGLVVYRYDAPLCFANADDFHRRALEAVETTDASVEWFLLNAEAIVELDLTGADALGGLRDQLGERGVEFALAHVKQELREELDAAGLAAKIGADRIFATLPAAVAAYTRWYVRRHGHLPAGMTPPVVPPSPMTRAPE